MKFIDKYNVVIGGIITFMSAIFGIYWYIFAAYAALNVIDWLSGWYKARQKRTESSKKGLKGILKKVGYWGIIAVSFLISSVFVQLGQDILHINLLFLNLIGWLTLAMLMVNEARSILENFVECGYNVPEFLIRGLAITQKLIEAGFTKDDTKEDNK